jgi:hypothetical protein
MKVACAILTKERNAKKNDFINYTQHRLFFQHGKKNLPIPFMPRFTFPVNR